MYMMHTCTYMHYIIAHVYYVHDALRNYTCYVHEAYMYMMHTCICMHTCI